MNKILRSLWQVLTLLGVSATSGCASWNSSVAPVETWRPAIVNETTLQALQSEVKSYSNDLSIILNRAKEADDEKASAVSELQQPTL